VSSRTDAKWAVVVWLDELPNLNRLTPVVAGYFKSKERAFDRMRKIDQHGWESEVRPAGQARRLKYQSTAAYDAERKRLQRSALSGCSCGR
jgi:hypothetical protein